MMGNQGGKRARAEPETPAWVKMWSNLVLKLLLFVRPVLRMLQNLCRPGPMEAVRLMRGNWEEIPLAYLNEVQGRIEPGDQKQTSRTRTHHGQPARDPGQLRGVDRGKSSRATVCRASETGAGMADAATIGDCLWKCRSGNESTVDRRPDEVEPGAARAQAAAPRLPHR